MTVAQTTRQSDCRVRKKKEEKNVTINRSAEPRGANYREKVSIRKTLHTGAPGCAQEVEQPYS